MEVFLEYLCAVSIGIGAGFIAGVLIDCVTDVDMDVHE